MSGNEILKSKKRIPYSETISFTILQITRLMKTFAKEILDEKLNNLKTDEYMILDIIESNSGLCQKDVAEMSVIEKGRICKIISVLEEKNFIKKMPSVKNKKLINELKITEAGMNCLNENSVIVDSVRSMIHNIFTDEEICDLHTKLKKLLNYAQNVTLEELKEKKCKTI